MSNACVIPCPYCAKDIDIIQGMEVLAGQQWTALLKPLPNSVIGALLRYLELFKPLKQELRWSRRLVLTQEIVPMMTAAQVKRNGIVYAAPLPVWEAEMMKLVVNRPESLVLPLKSNGYLLSMHQYRPDGSADDAYLDINTPEVMERIRESQIAAAKRKFTGTAAAENDEGYKPGLRITTKDSVTALLLSHYQNVLVREFGWCQKYDYYKANLYVEQDPLNPSRFNFRDTPVPLSPFKILAGRAQFVKRV